jgi:two-component system, chemotaxis family, protein-glutamate methylesterase/glutaminase
MTGKKIRVLIIDDSALVRSLLTEIVSAESDMEVVGAARDPLAARSLVRELNPDVITLDVEMPRMNGLEFLDKLMRLRPTPVVMISSLTQSGAEATLRALELGAVDFVAKPRLGIAEGFVGTAAEIAAKIRAAACSRMRAPRAAERSPALLPSRTAAGTQRLVCIGASTGGTEAVREILETFPGDAPATLITLHMPAEFTGRFAARLDGICRPRVSEAQDGERVLPGHAYVAPGGRHLTLKRNGSGYVVRIHDDPPVNRHRPSVDVLFDSAADQAGADAIGVLLTGMGKDGARGLLAMRDTGAWTIAQDEATSVVFGMPREAIAIGAAQEVLPIEAVGAAIFEQLGRPRAVRA